MKVLLTLWFIFQFVVLFVDAYRKAYAKPPTAGAVLGGFFLMVFFIYGLWAWV